MMELNVSRSVGMKASEKGVVLAFFSVVASYSNLSTVFNGCKDKHYSPTILQITRSLTLGTSLFRRN